MLTDNYEDVSAKKANYDEYIMGSALRVLQKHGFGKPEYTLEELATKALASYGGSLEIAIIDAFRNKFY